jgi:hypothetical protein
LGARCDSCGSSCASGNEGQGGCGDTWQRCTQTGCVHCGLKGCKPWTHTRGDRGVDYSVVVLAAATPCCRKGRCGGGGTTTAHASGHILVHRVLHDRVGARGREHGRQTNSSPSANFENREHARIVNCMRACAVGGVGAWATWGASCILVQPQVLATHRAQLSKANMAHTEPIIGLHVPRSNVHLESE